MATLLSLLISGAALLIFSLTLRLNRYRFRRGEDAVVLGGALLTFCPLIVAYWGRPPSAGVIHLPHLLLVAWTGFALYWFLHEITRLDHRFKR